MVRLIRVNRGQIPLAGLSRRRKPVLPMPKESDVQAAIAEALRHHGLKVLVTSRIRKKVFCKACRNWFWPIGPDAGPTTGLPDLFVRRSETTRFGRAWPPLLWIALEIKPFLGAKIRPEQQALVDAGDSVIAHETQFALDTIRAIDERLGCL